VLHYHEIYLLSLMNRVDVFATCKVHLFLMARQVIQVSSVAKDGESGLTLPTASDLGKAVGG
jgi:hypothetical protein